MYTLLPRDLIFFLFSDVVVVAVVGGVACSNLVQRDGIFYSLLRKNFETYAVVCYCHELSGCLHTLLLLLHISSDAIDAKCACVFIFSTHLNRRQVIWNGKILDNFWFCFLFAHIEVRLHAIYLVVNLVDSEEFVSVSMRAVRESF